jgi:hypothetical protein
MWTMTSKIFSLKSQSNFVAYLDLWTHYFLNELSKKWVWILIFKKLSESFFSFEANLHKVMHFQQVMLFSFINYQIYYDKKHSWVKSNGKQKLLMLWHKHFFRFCIKGKVLQLKHSLSNLKVEPKVQRKISWWQKLLQLIIGVNSKFYI